jgi:hypothetical protein
MWKKPISTQLETTIMLKTIQNNAKTQNFTEMKIKKDYLYSIAFFYQDLPNERPNLYGLHIFTKFKLIGLDHIIKSLGNQFEKYGLHQLEEIQFGIIVEAILKRLQTVNVCLNSNTIELSLDWEGKTINAGKSELWA